MNFLLSEVLHKNHENINLPSTCSTMKEALEIAPHLIKSDSKGIYLHDFLVLLNI